MKTIFAVLVLACACVAQTVPSGSSVSRPNGGSVANKSQVCSAGGTGCGATPGDFTSANSSSPQAITGLVVGPLPINRAVKVNFHCWGIYNQATGSASDSFGVTNSVAPTNEMVVGRAATGVGTAQQNAAAAIADTSSHSAVAFTGASATDLPFWIDGQIDQPSGSANTVQITIKNGTAANVIIIRRGATCEWD